MPATYSAYPTDTQLATYITGLGVTLPSGFDSAPYSFAAYQEWEKLTNQRPFLQGASASYYYDPPGPTSRSEWRGGYKILNLERGFTAITAVATGLTADDSTGTAQTVLQDYRLLPYNALADGEPYTAIEFAVTQKGGPRSIKVTGTPGYTASIKADAFQAILELGAALCLRAMREQLSQGVIDWREDDVSERKSIELIAKLGDTLYSRAKVVAMRYLRIS